MKKHFLVVLSMLLVIFMSVAAFSACDNPNPDVGGTGGGGNGGGGSSKVKVTINCGANGTATLDAEDGMYDVGATMKLTIVPSTGFEIGAVKENGMYDISEAVLTSGGKEPTDPGERTYEATVYKDTTYDVSFQTQGIWDDKYSNCTVTVKNNNTKFCTITYSPLKEVYERNEKITVTATLDRTVSSRMRAGRFDIGDVHYASEVNKVEDGKAFSVEVPVTKANFVIDAYFDDWTKELSVDGTQMDVYRDAINQELVFVDYWAEWCGPCKMLSPILRGFSRLGYVKVISCNSDLDENGSLDSQFDEYNMASIPTVIFFRYGKEVKNYICSSCNNVVVDTECPEACEKCGKEMGEEIEVSCLACNGAVVYKGLDSAYNMPATCPTCGYDTSIAYSSVNTYRMVGLNADLQSNNKDTQYRYLCKYAGLDYDLLQGNNK